jgi:hypothetical protein
VFGDVPFASGGPGSAGGAHGPDEWAEIEGLRTLMHVTYDALALLGLGPPDADRHSQNARRDASRT